MNTSELREYFTEQATVLEAELAKLQGEHADLKAANPDNTEDLDMLERKILLVSLELEDARERIFILDAQPTT